MKKTHAFYGVLVLSLLFAGTGAFAQRYKIKDDVITYEKAPVGKVVGDAGFDKTNLEILGNNGDKVLIVTQGMFNIKNPFFSYINWYNVKFADTGKEMKLYHGGSCNTRCLLNSILSAKGFQFDGSFVKDQDAIIAKSDVSEKINKDTTEILDKHNLWLKLLEKNSILRDKEKPVNVIKESESLNVETTTSVYNVAQDNIIIGKIVKYHTQSSTRVETSYAFFEKLYQPEGSLNEVPAGKVTDTFMDLKFVTIIDGKEHKMKMDDKTNAQNALATYLVSKGYF